MIPRRLALALLVAACGSPKPQADSTVPLPAPDTVEAAKAPLVDSTSTVQRAAPASKTGTRTKSGNTKAKTPVLRDSVIDAKKIRRVP